MTTDAICFRAKQLQTGNDKREARPLLTKTKSITQPQRLFADKGYDAE
ncbi:hypothetical protein Pla110_42990 [Polystyrenella longa]|uniref:Transposase IS4-like domain-containing protein n=1 Tax=Polystyrenella longa TaxID=2528007 RepID=A0A518CTI2_9PLAN|nr:hypothetical protein [Polystyrenella longa]QDU82541.1 hypothetical protein Pla110_42990 [Polystyrenella longa]